MWRPLNALACAKFRIRRFEYCMKSLPYEIIILNSNCPRFALTYFERRVCLLIHYIPLLSRYLLPVNQTVCLFKSSMALFGYRQSHFNPFLSCGFLFTSYCSLLSRHFLRFAVRLSCGSRLFTDGSHRHFLPRALAFCFSQLWCALVYRMSALRRLCSALYSSLDLLAPLTKIINIPNLLVFYIFMFRLFWFCERDLICPLQKRIFRYWLRLLHITECSF